MSRIEKAKLESATPQSNAPKNENMKNLKQTRKGRNEEKPQNMKAYVGADTYFRCVTHV